MRTKIYLALLEVATIFVGGDYPPQFRRHIKSKIDKLGLHLSIDHRFMYRYELVDPAAVGALLTKSSNAALVRRFVCRTAFWK